MNAILFEVWLNEEVLFTRALLNSRGSLEPTGRARAVHHDRTSQESFDRSISIHAGGDGGRVLRKIWSHGYNAQVNVNINTNVSQSFWLFCAICAWYCDIMLNCLFNWAWQCREYSTETCIVKLGESQVPVLKIKNNTYLLQHSGLDPQTSQWINATDCRSRVGLIMQRSRLGFLTLVFPNPQIPHICKLQNLRWTRSEIRVLGAEKLSGVFALNWVILNIQCYLLSVRVKAGMMTVLSRAYSVSEMTYTVSSGTLNPSIPYHTIPGLILRKILDCTGGDIYGERRARAYNGSAPGQVVRGQSPLKLTAF